MHGKKDEQLREGVSRYEALQNTKNSGSCFRSMSHDVERGIEQVLRYKKLYFRNSVTLTGTKNTGYVRS